MVKLDTIVLIQVNIEVLHILYGIYHKIYLAKFV